MRILPVVRKESVIFFDFFFKKRERIDIFLDRRPCWIPYQIAALVTCRMDGWMDPWMFFTLL